MTPEPEYDEDLVENEAAIDDRVSCCWQRVHIARMARSEREAYLREKEAREKAEAERDRAMVAESLLRAVLMGIEEADEQGGLFSELPWAGSNMERTYRVASAWLEQEAQG